MTNAVKGIILSIIIGIVGFFMSACGEVALKEIKIVGLPSGEIVVGQIFTLSVVCLPDNTTDKRVEWEMPQNDVVHMQKISQDYVNIEAINTGRIIITVRAYDGNLTDSIEIVVTSNEVEMNFNDAVNGVITREYNGEPQEVTANFASDDIVYYYKEQGQTEYTTVAPTYVGTYDIKAEMNSDNYTGSCEGVLQILPRQINVRADNKEVQYGDDEVALSYRVDGKITDENIVVSGQLMRESGINAGNYRIYQSTEFTISGEKSENYKINFIEGNYYIRPCDINVIVSAKNTYYGMEIENPTYQVFGLKYKNTVDDLGIQIEATSDNLSAGVHTLNCTHTNANYNLIYQNNTITIYKAPITITIGTQTKKYKTIEPTQYDYTIYNANNSDTSQLFYDDELILKFVRQDGEDVGTYEVNAVISGDCADNYNATINLGSLEITPRIINIQVLDATKRYGQVDPQYTYEFLENGDEIVDNELSIEVIRDNGENVGEYNITAIAHQDKNNYTLDSISGKLTITKAVVYIKVADTTKIYMDADPIFDFEYLDNSDAIIEGNSLQFEYSRVTGENVGDYNVSMNIVTQDPNYSVSTQSGKLTITKRHLVYNVSDISIRYKQTPYPSDVQVQLDTLVGDENVEGLNILDYYNTTINYDNFVGVYPIIFNNTTKLDNYDITFVGGNLIINPAEVIINIDNKIFKYGEEMKFTYQFDASSDTVIDGELIVNLWGENTDIGTYDIQCSVSEIEDRDNYNVIINGAEYQIIKRTYILKINDCTKTVGSQDPNYNYSVFEGSDEILEEDLALIQIQYTRTEGEEVGTYTISGQATDGEHYTIKIIDGQLTITQ